MEDKIDQMLSGILLKLYNFLPMKLPILMNINWKQLTKIGNKVELIPIMLLPIPIQKLSRDSASPKNRASFESIELDLSKSEEIGSFIIFIVIPRNFIKKW